MLKLSLIQRNKSNGSKIWYIREYDSNTKELRYISTATKNKAIALELLENHRKESLLSPMDKLKKQLPTIKKALVEWLEMVSKNNSVKTYNSYKSHAKRLQTIEEIKIDELSTAIANKFFLDLPQKMTINSRIKALKIYSSFIQWSFNNYDIEKVNPFKRVNLPKKENKEVYFWTLEEIEKILEHTPTIEKRFFYSLMAFCGLRFFEVESLTHEQINTENRTLSLKGKGGKISTIPISKRVILEYERFLAVLGKEPKGKIFKDTYNSTENLLLKRICDKLDINKKGSISCHRFRHSFASNLLRKGASIISVSKLMRHEQPSLTLNIYSHILPNDLIETLELLNK